MSNDPVTIIESFELEGKTIWFDDGELLSIGNTNETEPLARLLFAKMYGQHDTVPDRDGNEERPSIPKPELFDWVTRYARLTTPSLAPLTLSSRMTSPSTKLWASLVCATTKG